MNDGAKWRFSFWPMLAFVCVLPALLWLGAWQVQRGGEKAAAFEDFARSAAGPARDVTGLPLNAFNTLPRYERVKLQGHYLEGRHFLLDNLSYKGRPGHHVLTPFLPDGADYVVIVDRGWRPGRAVNNGDTPLDADAPVIIGMLAALPRPALQLEGKPVHEGWPRVVQFPDSRELAVMLERPVAVPRLLLQEQASGGFERDWEPPSIPPARHYAYAFQWFGLAAALIVIFIIMARPKRAEKSKESAE